MKNRFIQLIQLMRKDWKKIIGFLGAVFFGVFLLPFFLSAISSIFHENSIKISYQLNESKKKETVLDIPKETYDKDKTKYGRIALLGELNVIDGNNKDSAKTIQSLTSNRARNDLLEKAESNLIVNQYISNMHKTTTQKVKDVFDSQVKEDKTGLLAYYQVYDIAIDSVDEPNAGPISDTVLNSLNAGESIDKIKSDVMNQKYGGLPKIEPKERIAVDFKDDSVYKHMTNDSKFIAHDDKWHKFTDGSTIHIFLTKDLIEHDKVSVPKVKEDIFNRLKNDKDKKKFLKEEVKVHGKVTKEIY